MAAQKEVDSVPVLEVGSPNSGHGQGCPRGAAGEGPSGLSQLLGALGAPWLVASSSGLCLCAHMAFASLLVQPLRYHF